MVKIKICGVTNVSDALQAAELGADCVGLNFHGPSPRFILKARAVEIIRELPPFVEPVAVFVNEPIKKIMKTMAELGLRTFQWHGNRWQPDPLPTGNFHYTLNEFRQQLANIKNVSSLSEMMPEGFAEAQDPAVVLGRAQDMMDVMTESERAEPDLIDAAARQRIASASNTSAEEVKAFLDQFQQMRSMMKKLTGMSTWQRLKVITGMSKKQEDYADVVLPTPAHPLRLIPAFGVRDKLSLQVIVAYLDQCKSDGQLPAAILVDAHVPGSYGGTGQTLPWELLADFSPGVPLILAGGLTAANVAQAIRLVRPYAVDVASGVESSPGKKDAAKMKQFIDQVRSTEV